MADGREDVKADEKAAFKKEPAGTKMVPFIRKLLSKSKAGKPTVSAMPTKMKDEVSCAGGAGSCARASISPAFPLLTNTKH